MESETNQKLAQRVLKWAFYQSTHQFSETEKIEIELDLIRSLDDSPKKDFDGAKVMAEQIMKFRASLHRP